ncbi:MAG TPA: ABC transporter permease [Steroidobacteraceae bacterium]|nr:ABC transporter permease [Steroidobacteraceae bacterium]
MWKQIAAVTAMNLRSLPQRLAASLVVVIGVAGVVGVLVSVLGMATGLSHAFVSTGGPSRAIVLHKAATSEGLSNIDISWVGPIEDGPGVLRGPTGHVAATPEYIVGVNLPKRSDGVESGVTLRGTSAAALLVHPEWRIVSGRMFRPGLREVVVGAAAASEFSGLEIGRHVELGGNDWTVVGRFTSGGDSHDSEILADARTLMSAFNWGAYSSVTVRLDAPASFDRFRRTLLSNPSLEIDVVREQDYYRGQAQQITGLLYLVSTVVGAIMAIGAVFTALNTLYAAVAARTAEIATLRAIGFGPAGVVVSVLVEALLLSVLGALLGAAVAWLLFNGDALSTGGGQFDSQVAFRLLVGPSLVAVGIAWACAIGLLGGLLPAIRAARQPVAVALRPT